MFTVKELDKDMQESGFNTCTVGTREILGYIKSTLYCMYMNADLTKGSFGH